MAKNNQNWKQLIYNGVCYLQEQNNDAAAALKMDTCVKLVSGITDCFLKDRENSRQVYYKELGAPAEENTQLHFAI